MEKSQMQTDYRRIEQALAYIKAHQTEQPSLEQIAAAVHMSPYHFHRLFSRWAGISPKKFLQYLTLQHARECLEKNITLEETAHITGLSGTGRLYDLFITLEGMTPGNYRKAGLGLRIYYGFHSSPFGKYLLALTGENKICTLQFVEEEVRGLKELKEHWGASMLVHDPNRTGKVAADLFDPGHSAPISLFVKGTNFQLKVWEALLKIPFGTLVSYQTIAAAVNNPGAVQAVGSAIGRNPVAYLIPCHRVIRKTGQISEYRWGSLRKSAILAWEASRCNN